MTKFANRDTSFGDQLAGHFTQRIDAGGIAGMKSFPPAPRHARDSAAVALVDDEEALDGATVALEALERGDPGADARKASLDPTFEVTMDDVAGAPPRRG